MGIFLQARVPKLKDVAMPGDETFSGIWTENRLEMFFLFFHV